MLIGFILLVVLAALAPVGVTNCSNPELFLEVEGGVALFLVLVLGGIIYKKYELLIEIEQKNEAQPLRDDIRFHTSQIRTIQSMMKQKSLPVAASVEENPSLPGSVNEGL
jgi:hypothetical protein